MQTEEHKLLGLHVELCLDNVWNEAAGQSGRCGRKCGCGRHDGLLLCCLGKGGSARAGLPETESGGGPYGWECIFTSQGQEELLLLWLLSLHGTTPQTCTFLTIPHITQLLSLPAEHLEVAPVGGPLACMSPDQVIDCVHYNNCYFSTLLWSGTELEAAFISSH